MARCFLWESQPFFLCVCMCVCVCVCAHVHADVWAWGGEEPLNWGCPGESDSCGFHESDICPNALGVISQLPPDSYVEILTPSVMVLLLYGVIRSWVWALTCTFKEKSAFTCTFKEKSAFHSPLEGPHRDLAGTSDFSLLSCEKWRNSCWRAIQFMVWCYRRPSRLTPHVHKPWQTLQWLSKRASRRVGQTMLSRFLSCGTSQTFSYIQLHCGTSRKGRVFF